VLSTPYAGSLTLPAYYPQKNYPQKSKKSKEINLKSKEKSKEVNLQMQRSRCESFVEKLRKMNLICCFRFRSPPFRFRPPPNAFEKRRQEDEKRENDLKRRRLLLENFLKELDRSVARVDQQSRDAKPKRSGGKKDYQKRDAALNAFILLRGFSGKLPTLTVDAAFHELAGTLYKAATGKTADLYPQCRTLFKSIRGSGSKPS
jgi:hypothetical protein